MATYELPSYVHWQETRLYVDAPTDPGERYALRTLAVSSPYREVWMGQLVPAPMSRLQAAQFAGFLEQLDGRVDSFHFIAGQLGQPNNYVATVAADVPPGADRIRLAYSAGSGEIKPGTLFAVGTVASNYALHEIVAPAVIRGGEADVFVAPRTRRSYAAGTVVGFATPRFRLRLRGEAFDWRVEIDRGTCVLDVVEAAS